MARRTDSNQAQVMRGLRAMGYRVEDLSQVGSGVPDLLVGTPCSRLVLLEVKDGAKPPSRRALTPDQQAWHLEWDRFPVFVVLSAEDAHTQIAKYLSP